MRKTTFLYTAIAFALASCSGDKSKARVESATPVEFSVERAPEWTALFKRSQGWFGGDGIFAIPFSGVDAAPNDSVLFLFSDTMVGEITEGKLQPGYSMVNNSVMILDGKEPVEEQSRFLVKQTQTNGPATLFVPNTPSTKPGDYYWLGDGFVNHKNGNLYISAYRIRNTNDGSPFPFEEVGNVLIAIPPQSKFPFEDHRQMELPFNKEEDTTHISFGAAILSNTVADQTFNPDGFVYVYGIRGKRKELVAARVAEGDVENFKAWEFWDGNNWSPQVKQAAALEDSVSNELSVTPVGGNRYALVYQYGGIYPAIYIQFGPSPVGPFGPRQKVWDTTNDINDPDLFTYNAKAHPAISKPGELLVSYNVNSFKFFEVIDDKPDLYRPRFIRIVFSPGK